jgi:DNA-binding MarR family transcriptional regulator
MPQQESIGKWISTIYRRSQIYINKNLDHYGLTSSQYLTLLIVQRNEGVNQETISHELFLDKATIARSVMKLVKQGYMKRMVDPNDRRAYILFLTKKGEKIIPRIRKVLERTSDIFLTGFSKQEKQQALALMKKMYQNITEIDNQ